jgi:GMP reductase
MIPLTYFAIAYIIYVMRIETDVKLDFKDVLIRPKRSTLGSRKEVSLNREFRYRNSDWRYSTIPIMASNMDGVGTFTMADKLTELNLFTCLVKTYNTKELIDYFKDAHYKKLNSVAMSIGITDSDLEKWREVRKNTEVRYVCIDVANGYSERFSEFVKKFRDEYPRTTIIAGNVVTGEMTEELILNGADIVKVGIGPGSVCTTRLQTGVGYPQLSAVIECADAAHGLGGHIIADGGCTNPGDIAKAFAGGADFVMLGGMLAGHDEGEGNIITKQYATNELSSKSRLVGSQSFVTEEKKFVQFYGMSSTAANKKHFGGLREYRSSEGREVLVPYRGAVANTIQDILGGVRSTCTYAGANKLKQLSKCTTFVRCTQTHNGIYEKSTIGN